MKEEGFECVVKGLVLGLPYELLTVFLVVVPVNILLPPIHHENCLEEGICAFCHSGSVGSCKCIGAELDYVWKLTTV